MVTQDQVREALRSVNDPEIGRPIEDIGMLRDIEVLDGGLVRVHVLITIEGCPLKDRITRDVTEALAPLEGVERVDVALSPMSEEQRASLVATLRGGEAPQQQPTFFTGSDTTVIAVASGKGGVGKSSVTVNLACALAAEGHRVGVLDADVWGFSVPRMMGVTGKPVGFNDMILPLESHGVKVISMGFFVPEETPVIWRGPMLHKAIEQFLGDVYWGDLDFLLCDLPPGTGDVSISLASFLPGASMLVVTTPQCGQTNHDIFSITPIFGQGGGNEAAETLGVPLFAQVPLEPALREGGDDGAPIVVTDPDSPAGEALRRAARELAHTTRSKVGKQLPLMAVPGASVTAGGHHGHAH